MKELQAIGTNDLIGQALTPIRSSGKVIATLLEVIFWKRLFLVYTLPLILTIYFLTVFGIFERPDLFFLDRAFQWRGEREPRNEITVVAISQLDFQQGAPRWPWPRSLMARFIDQIASYQPAAIAIDILYTERSNTEAVITSDKFKEIQPYVYQVFSGVELKIQTSQGTRVIGPGSEAFDYLVSGASSAKIQDLELAHAIQRARDRGIGIVLAADSVYGGSVVGLTEPYSELADAAGHSLGLVSIQTDIDGALRRYIPSRRTKDGQFIYGLALAAIAESRHIKLPDTPSDNGEVRLGEDLSVPVTGGPFLVNFRGPPGTHRTLNARQILRGEEELSDQLKNKIVFLGVSDPSVEDLFSTPFAGREQMAGVEYHAAAADTLLSGEMITEAPAYQGSAMLVLLGLVAIVLGRFARLIFGIVGMIGVLAAVFGVWMAAFTEANYLLPISASVTAAVLGYGFSITDRVSVEQLEKQRTRAVFSRYLDPGIVKELLRNPTAARLGGNRAELTVLFSDIRGFTSLSSLLPPEEVVELLNTYLTVMTEIVFQQGGTIDKFAGDGIMAFFGAPQSHSDDPRRAVRTAVAMRDGIAALQAQWQHRAQVPLRIGIGIDTGYAVVGNIGSPGRMDYTIIGDVVNLASRLQDLTKEYDTPILISENTYSKVKDAGEFRNLGITAIRGRPQPVDLYELIDLKADPASLVGDGPAAN